MAYPPLHSGAETDAADPQQVDPAPPADAASATAMRGGWLVTLLLGTDRQQRMRITRSLLASLVFVVCIALIAYLTALGIMDPLEGRLLTAGMLISNISFYIALRSGFNQRFSEPALTLPQILAALTWVAGAYAITNEVHGGTLMLVALVLVFGVYNMNRRRTRIASTYAVCLMGAVMLFESWDDPLHYPAKVEWVYFVFVATIVPTIAVLAAQLDLMRHRLKQQKADLSAALARIGELATRDELTSLINRRQMQQVLAEHAAMSKRSMVAFSVALLDLDQFKRINDTYGHGVGDETLRGFSAEARRVLRETDVIARWGGEEFLLLMPEVPPGAPAIGIERLRAALVGCQISNSVPDLRIAFSAGITAYRPGEAMDQTIERADHALYQAKAAGRDQLIVA
ncbi:MAG: diguanylate cyclase [Pseudomonadota bacterium]